MQVLTAVIRTLNSYVESSDLHPVFLSLYMHGYFVFTRIMGILHKTNYTFYFTY